MGVAQPGAQSLDEAHILDSVRVDLKWIIEEAAPVKDPREAVANQHHRVRCRVGKHVRFPVPVLLPIPDLQGLARLRLSVRDGQNLLPPPHHPIRLGEEAVAPQVHAFIERCGLGDVRRRLLGNLSKGFQQRAGIAQAIVHDPALIVLDEPASGLDPLQSANIRALIRELGKDRAVILSTHLIADVNQCCDRVAILHRGRLRYDGPVQMLSHDPVFDVRVSKTPAQEAWAAIAGVESAHFADGFWLVTLKPDARPETLAESIVRQGWGLLEFRAQQTNLEQVFLRIASADETAAAA